MPNIIAGTGVGFLTGTQASLDTMLGQGTLANAIEGYFYLAEDTHRLYIGNHDHSISPVNEGITFVTSTAQLPTITTSNQRALQGQFYYVAGTDNILCVCSGDKWVQINPDTHLLGTDEADTGTVLQSTINTGMVRVTSGTSANSAMVKARVQDTHGGTNATPINTVGGRFTIKGGNNITVTPDSTTDSITISAPDGAIYNLVLENDSQHTQGEGDHQVNLVLKETTASGTTTKATIPIIDGDSVYPVIDNGKLKLAGGGFGNCTVEISTDANGELTIDLVDDNNNHLPIEFTPEITIGQGANATQKHFTYTPGANNTPGTLSLDLGTYTKDEIDSMFTENMQGFDAMHFAGTIGNSNATYANLTTLKNATNISSGSVFKVIEEIEPPVPSGMTIEGWPITDRDEVMEVGDMIIVTGTETNGVITSNIKYTYIPSGNDEDQYYQPALNQSNKQITFTNSLDNNDVYTLKFTDTDTTSSADSSATPQVVVTSTVSGKTETINVRHKHFATVTPVADTANAVTQSGDNEDPEYVAVSELTIDNGHVTGYKTKKLQLWSNHLSTVVSSAAVTNSTSSGITTYTGAITNVYTDDAGTQVGGLNKVNDWQISSDTLKIQVGNAGGSASTRAALNVNMVWGSFETT